MHSNDQELAELLGRCHQQDETALQTLYHRLAPYLNGIAYRIVQSDELSNEVLQEAFVQIWQNAGSYQPGLSKPLTWITSIVRYRAIDKRQQEKRHINHIEADPETLLDEQIPIENTSLIPSPEADYARTQLLGHIQQCMEPLNDKIKRCIEMAYLMGYSREELADEFDTKVNTVKSWLHRGSERLKQCLQSKQKTDLI